METVITFSGIKILDKGSACYRNLLNGSQMQLCICSDQYRPTYKCHVSKFLVEVLEQFPADTREYSEGCHAAVMLSPLARTADSRFVILLSNVWNKTAKISGLIYFAE